MTTTESIREQIAFARDHLNDHLRNETELRGSVMYGALDTMEKLLAVSEVADKWRTKLGPIDGTMEAWLELGKVLDDLERRHA